MLNYFDKVKNALFSCIGGVHCGVAVDVCKCSSFSTHTCQIKFDLQILLILKREICNVSVFLFKMLVR